MIGYTVSPHVHWVHNTYIAKDGSSSLVTGGDDIKIDSNVQHNGTNSYQIIHIGTGKPDQPELISW